MYCSVGNVASRRIITLLTDFGLKDPYVASMKGVIYSINPEVIVVDISHNISSFDIQEGAFVLACAFKYFPKGTVHVVVVDPGVGTERRGIVVESNNYLFVGPDNGVLMLAAHIDGARRVVEITNRKYMRSKITHTFHGRDIFAPVAAYLSLGVSISEIGKEIEDYMVPKFVKPEYSRDKVKAYVIHIDKFGNVITNVTSRIVFEELKWSYGQKLIVELPGGESMLVPFQKSYGFVKKGTPLLLIDSEDFLELAINMGSAAEEFGIARGALITIYPSSNSSV
ncbi:MAG: hypothetical protein DRN53_02510 [Thermoprotei archaeon]|nr:MAG: hypothetical protein DRN53_02510 [Thermoprotei archaeon]